MKRKIRKFSKAIGVIEILKNHEKLIKRELDSRKGKAELKSLLEYHQNQVRNFQHERIVHLLVTLTFGLATLISFGITLAFPYIGMLILDIIFFVMLAFYIKHYFVLENGVQRLYKINQEIKFHKKRLK